jgi:O-antigen/teichoic acid export membrane protein
VGIGLGFVITILLFPYILTTDQYGLTRLLISLALIAAQIAHLGIKNIIIRFLPYFRQSRDLKHGMLFLAITVPLVGFIFLSLLYFIFEGTITYYFHDDSALFAAYHLFLLPLIFGVLFFEVLNSYLQALQDSVTGSFVNEVAIRVLLILLLGVYYLALISFTTFMIFFVLIYTL